MPDDKNFFAGLFDFSFQYQLTRRLVKLLYIIGILAGGIRRHRSRHASGKLKAERRGCWPVLSARRRCWP